MLQKYIEELEIIQERLNQASQKKHAVVLLKVEGYHYVWFPHKKPNRLFSWWRSLSHVQGFRRTPQKLPGLVLDIDTAVYEKLMYSIDWEYKVLGHIGKEEQSVLQERMLCHRHKGYYAAIKKANKKK